MKRTILTVLAVVVALALVPLDVQAAPAAPYYVSVSATQTNSATSFGFNAGVVIVHNDGANEAFVRWNAAAVAGGTSSVEIPAGKGKRFLFVSGRGPTSVGTICSTGETATVRIEAYQHDGQVEVFPLAETVTDIDDFDTIATGEVTSAMILDATIAAGDLAADAVTEAKLKAVDAASDEDVLTYESTTGDFEWHSVAQIMGQATEGSLTDSSVVTADIKDGEIVNADISASAAITRSRLAEDALQPFAVSVGDIQNAAYAALTVGATDGADALTDVVWGTNTLNLQGDASDNETETQTFVFHFRLPENYVAAGDVSLQFRGALIESGAAATDNGSSIDAACYELTDFTPGADIVSTAAQTYAATDVWETNTLALTATDLVAGDLVLCTVTLSTIENNAGGETIIQKVLPPVVLVDVKG